MLVIRFIIISSLAILFACESETNNWSQKELNIISSLSLKKLPANIKSPSNRYAEDIKAINFGKRIFFDKRFSADGSLSCASCHQPDKAFTDGLNKAQGVNATGRNTQTLIGVVYQNWFYWDGRKDSLWSQALIPFEAADEMASSRLHVLRIIGHDKQYRKFYEGLFGQFPEIILQDKQPKNAGPLGDAKTQDNWYRIPLVIQRQINAAYANIGKAVAAYERTIVIPETKFDRFVSVLLQGEESKANNILNETERAGLKLFINQSKTHCLRCHNGPMFTNTDFHNIGSGNFTGSQLDFGRYLGLQAVIQDEFNCLGEYSDAEAEDCLALRFLAKEIHIELQGAYKTPTLRYLTKTAPYFHDGRYNNIEQVMQHYLASPANGSELPPLVLTTEESNQVQAFLHTLN